MSAMAPMSEANFAAMVREFCEADAIEVGGRLYIAEEKILTVIAGGKLKVARIRHGNETEFSNGDRPNE